MPEIPEIVVLTLRAASFIADLQAAGIAMFLFIFIRYLEHSASAIRTLGIAAAVIGLLLTLGTHLMEPARMAGSLSGVFDKSMHTMLLSTNVSAAVAIRMSGLVLLVLGLRGGHRQGDAASLIGAAFVTFSFTLTGHTAAHDMRWILVVLLAIHLLIISLWFGSLLPLSVISKRENVEVTSAVIDAFSAFATKIVPAIFVVGLGMSVLLLEELKNLWTPYGVSILLKVAGFAALIGLAALNKWRLGPAIASGNAASLIAFRRSVSAELILIITVITVTAVMTGLFSPTH